MRLVEQLSLAYRQIRAAARHSAAARTARPLQHLRALKAIREGLHTQGELAERLFIDPPAVSRLVDRLVADGLIERRAGDDRRCVKLVLCKPAAQAIAIGDQVVDDVEQHLRRHLTADEARTLRALLTKLIAGLAADAAAVAPGRAAPR
ncbi:MAG: MarR family transcriptional regulator [Myxococcales bacterium]|nr:MarR family transcriptional regulator [Myxococcales bacterium]